jgi:hypothetical protein
MATGGELIVLSLEENMRHNANFVLAFVIKCGRVMFVEEAFWISSDS